MKKKVALMFAVSVVFLSLSGCLDGFGSPPSDDACREIISAYLLAHSNFYDTDDVINLGDWLGVGCQTRSFDWCHTQDPDVTGTYCGVGYINSNRVITYNGE